jgi:hypothetical protein
MTKRFQALMLAIALSTSGCAGVQKFVDALPTIVQYVQDAAIILDSIDQAVLPILAMRQDPELGRKYSSAMDAARQSLQVALRSAKGGEQLSENKLDEAFISFRQAYIQLLSLLQQANLMGATGAMAAAPGMPQVVVQTPLAMQ